MTVTDAASRAQDPALSGTRSKTRSGGGVTAPRPRRRSKAENRRRLVIMSMLAPAVIGLLLFFAYPLIDSIYLSFTSYSLLSPPKWIGLRNYEYLFTQDPQVWTAAFNTMWFVVILVPVRVLCALGMAGLLVRAKQASGLWRTIFYLPALVPPVASVVAFVFLFNPGTGPVNLLLKSIGIQGPLWFNDPAWAKPSLVVLGVWVMGDVMIILLAALLDVPKELYEATSLDGANGVQQVRWITLPTIAPVIGFAAVTGVIAALQYFTEAAVASGVASGKATIGSGAGELMGYPNDSLLTYAQWIYYRGFENYQMGYASALAVVLFVVSALLLVLVMRKISAFNPGESS